MATHTIAECIAALNDIKDDKSTLRQNIIDKGVTVPSDASLADLSTTYVTSIQTPYPEETTTVTPTNSSQTITPTTGSVFSSVSVNGYDVDEVHGSLQTIIDEGVPTKFLAWTGGGTCNYWDQDSTIHPEATSPVVSSSTLTNVTKFNFGGNSYITALNRYPHDITDASSMFTMCTALTTAPSIDLSNVTSTVAMFNGCSALTTVPIYDTGNVTSMTSMFASCSVLESIPLLNTSAATEMGSMFRGCSALASIPELDTSSCTKMTSMFDACTSLTTLSGLNTASVTTFQYFCRGCTSLVNVSGLSTVGISNANAMNAMFSGCTALQSVDSINFSGLTKAPAQTFYNCSSLVNITFDEGSYLNYNLSIEQSPNLSFQTISGLLTVASNSTTSTSKTLKLNNTLSGLTTEQVAELDTLKALCQSKGWNITGLTYSADENIEDNPEVSGWE